MAIGIFFILSLLGLVIGWFVGCKINKYIEYRINQYIESQINKQIEIQLKILVPSKVEVEIEKQVDEFVVSRLESLVYNELNKPFRASTLISWMKQLKVQQRVHALVKYELERHHYMQTVYVDQPEPHPQPTGPATLLDFL